MHALDEPLDGRDATTALLITGKRGVICHHRQIAITCPTTPRHSLYIILLLIYKIQMRFLRKHQIYVDVFVAQNQHYVIVAFRQSNSDWAHLLALFLFGPQTISINLARHGEGALL